MITRRSMLAMGTGLVAGSALTPLSTQFSFAAPASGGLTMYGPPVGPSVTLASIAAQGKLDEAANGKVGFEIYKSPDVLRANFISGDWKLAVTPSYVAANLANKGLPVKMLNIMTWGMLYVLSYDGEVKKPENLAGETIGMFFRNDMPDLVFGTVMEKKGLVVGKDYQLHYVGTPFEALQLLLSGRIKHCVLPEPAATAGLLKGKKLGKKLSRAIDLASEWSAVTGAEGRFPMAGAMVHQELLDKDPAFVEAFHTACASGTEWVKDNTMAAAKIAAETMPLPAPVIAKSIPATHLTTQRASDIRTELEAFYSVLAEKNPAIIGGKLPPAEFYL
ncbi:ABC transporter substrate-binding protein [Cohaesibacter celericrescens]|uniref:ABC transporter substrate-binding protein n=1 Tax=Cohaesibacter celericrescens TaxID=2067669 RepID=A0A2N5XPW8_9HYPH|nr:ABC transporter substrate-binding protein [Cohaesibacter celericrescens]PLW76543.1 ABC transporter substrate-binding protein [Cohaesibacter celericrescens]